MKILKALTAGILVLMATAANSSTIFTPTDGDVNFLFSTIDGYDLYMFDDADLGNEAGAADSLFIPVPSIVGIAGPTGGGDYIATSETPDTLTLTGSSDFFLSLYDVSASTWLQDSGIVDHGANSYTVNFTAADGSFLVVDVKVIPVPAAVWLFGSGLIGLVGVARRRA